MSARLFPTGMTAAAAQWAPAGSFARRVLQVGLWIITAAFSPPALAQSVQLGTINVPVSVPTVPSSPVTVNVPTNVLGNLVNVPINLSGTVSTLNVLPTTVNVPINLFGNTVNVSINVPNTTITVTGGPITINVPIGLDAPISINIPAGGLVGTISAVDAIAAIRRNDTLLGLDLGLDRQIDILTSGSDYWDDSGGLWSQPSALGGPRQSPVAMLDGWGDSTRVPFFAETFATSLQQARQANAAAASDAAGGAYHLGATSRPAPLARNAFDLWVEGTISRFADGSDQSERHGHLGVIYLGADYRLARDVLVGTLVQYNETSHSFDALPTGGSDHGWMVGPYATIRLSTNLFFQARAAWGKTDVTVDLDSAHQDSFDANRWLVRGTLLGQWRWGPWQLRPRASVGYIEERQEGYASSLQMTIPSQTVALGQAKAGPEIAYRYRLANGSILQPSVLVEGIWNFARDGGSLSIDDLGVVDEVRGRVEAGLSLRTPGGAVFGAAVSYDGIGSSDYQALGGKVRVQVPID